MFFKKTMRGFGRGFKGRERHFFHRIYLSYSPFSSICQTFFLAQALLSFFACWRFFFLWPFFLFFLVFLPERYWNFILWALWENLSFLSLSCSGREASSSSFRDRNGLVTKGTPSIEIPRYKFHTVLTEKVLDYGRRFGSPLKGTLLEIREVWGKTLCLNVR